jgi:hypothetical protein
MVDAPRKTGLLALIARGRQEEHRVWARFSETDRSTEGTPQAWAMKDVVAHVSEWKERDAARLDAVRNGQAPERPTDFADANKAIFEAHRRKTWPELMELEARAYEHLISTIGAFKEEQLFDPNAYEWSQGRMLAWIAADIGFRHPHEHLSDLLTRLGDLHGAEAIQLGMVEGMDTIDDSPRGRGTNRYNAACFYALHGMPDKALEFLSQSFALMPDLTDWSNHDSDLDSLRDLPGFQALFPT